MPTLLPSAKDGLKLKKSPKAKKKKRAEVLKIGREKGQKASTRVRDILEMRKDVDYEKVLDSGETWKEYKQRTGKDKSLISKWRSKVKKADAKMTE